LARQHLPDEVVEIDTYRLWQTWQQMHYPRRGLPEHESARSDLVAIDGMVGTILERHFSRRPRAATLDADSHLALQQCQRDLDGFAKSLSSEASQYFGRAQVLIGFVLSREMANTAKRPSD